MIFILNNFPILYLFKSRFCLIRIKAAKDQKIYITMESYRAIDVFQPYKPLFHIVTVYNSKHFQDSDRRIWNICAAIVFTALIFGIIVLIVGDTWYCISSKFDLREIALPFGVLISGVQMSINYAVIAVKHQQLERAISGLQERIQRRKQTNI